MIPDQQKIIWDNANQTAHGTITLMTALINHLSGGATIFSDVRDKDNGVAQMIEALIQKQFEDQEDSIGYEGEDLDFLRDKRIGLMRAVKAFFE